MKGPNLHGPDVASRQLRKAPLDWIAAELDRLRACPAVLDHIANAPDYSSGGMTQAISDLRVDLPRFFACESAVILPILRLAAHRDDDIETACRILTANHRLLSGGIREILPRLDAFRSAEAPLGSDTWLVEQLHDLATRIRGHLALTAAVILPIARLRFKPADIDLLADELARQLGIA